MPSNVLRPSERLQVGEGKVAVLGKNFDFGKLDSAVIQVSDLSIAPDPVRLMLTFGEDIIIVPSEHPDYDALFLGLESTVGIDRDAFLRAMDCPVSCDFTLYAKK